MSRGVYKPRPIEWRCEQFNCLLMIEARLDASCNIQSKSNQGLHFKNNGLSNISTSLFRGWAPTLMNGIELCLTIVLLK